MFGIGASELMIILVIILIIFGVGKLPQVGEGLGKAIRGFKKGVSETEDLNEPVKKVNEDRGEHDEKKS